MLLICSQGSHKHVSQISLHCMQTRIYYNFVSKTARDCLIYPLPCHQLQSRQAWQALVDFMKGVPADISQSSCITLSRYRGHHRVLPCAAAWSIWTTSSSQHVQRKKDRVLEAITWGNIAFGHYIMSPPWHQPPDLCSLYCTRGDKRKCLPCATAWHTWKFFLTGYLWGNKAQW